MATSRDFDRATLSSHRPAGGAAVYGLLLASLLLGMPGCGGCQDSVTADRDALEKKLEEEKKEREKPKPPFEPGKMVTQPNGLLIDRPESAIKPGHWTNVTFEMLANLDDFSGELVTDPFQLEGMKFELGTSRPVQLPKGQAKHVEVTLYVPAGRGSRMITKRLLTSRYGREVLLETHPTTMLPAHQFYFVVLAERPDSYGFLRDTDSVNPPTGDWSSEANAAYYRVLLPHVGDRVPLPSNPLTWTSIAYLLWDNFDPTLLTLDQQQALLDWLHWGGQLIVSGPGTLDDLRSSFLSPYLPAASGEAMKLTAADFDVLNDDWTRDQQNALNPLKPWTGVKLLVDPEATDVHVVLASGTSEPLLVERRVGRGGIVVSAFRLSQRELRDWPAFDEFLNASLLRRQPRRFTAANDGVGIHVRWESPVAWRDDPRLVSSMRYFTRDAALLSTGDDWRTVTRKLSPDTASAINTAQTELAGRSPEEQSQLFADPDDKPIGSGVAGWDDHNLPAELARQSLIEAAGIRIPDALFVVRMLAIYLGVLVPVNWLVFRALGRVELAWVSVPILTIGFAGAVVYWAQLDIGFARSKTEVSAIEFNGGFERAHVTRYTALYTSLATSYDLQFDDPSALVQPFANHARDQAPPQVVGQTKITVNYRRAPPTSEERAELASTVTLEGFEIDSNALSMLHSEQMADLDGGIVLQGFPGGPQKVLNDSLLTLDDVAVVARAADDGTLQVAWIDGLAPGSSAELDFRAAADLAEVYARWDAAVISEPDVRPLLACAAATTEPGETRLVAWTGEEVPGMTIEPTTRQTDSAGIVVAHLRYPPRKDPQRDDVPISVVERQIERLLPAGQDGAQDVPVP